MPLFRRASRGLLDSAVTDVQQTGITGTAGSPTDITGLSIEFEVVNRPVLVTFFHPYLVTAGGAATPFLKIRQVSDGATVRDGNTAMSTAAGQFFHGTLSALLTTPGSYSLKASVWRAGAGTLTSLVDPSDGTEVAVLQAVEL